VLLTDMPIVFAALFLLGGAGIAVASVFARDKGKLWALFGLELVQVGAIVVPAWFGWSAFAYSVLGALSVAEVYRCAKAGNVYGGWVWAIGFAGGGFVAAWWVATQALSAFLFAYAVIEISDTLAWAMGNALGRHRMWPRLSPNKTWEGTLAGLVAGVAVGFGLRFLVADWSVLRVVGVALVVALSAMAGDLLASWIKRRAGWKNFSGLIPYQGGVFDLYDSLCLAMPVFWMIA
jgi:CDP-diglyceride synthetase